MDDGIIIRIDGGGGGSGVGGMLLIFLAIIVGFAVGIRALVGAIDSVAEKLGIPATVYVTVYNWKDDALHEKQDLVLAAKPEDSNGKEYQASFSKKGSAKVKTDPGNYIVSVRTTDYQYVFGECEAKRMRSYDYKFNGWFDTVNWSELNEKNEKTMLVYVYTDGDEDHYFNTIKDATVSVKMNHPGDDTVYMADAGEDEDHPNMVYIANPSDGYCTVSASADGYETQTRKIFVDDNSKVYCTIITLSKAEDDD